MCNVLPRDSQSCFVELLEALRGQAVPVEAEGVVGLVGARAQCFEREVRLGVAELVDALLFVARSLEAPFELLVDGVPPAQRAAQEF